MKDFIEPAIEGIDEEKHFLNLARLYNFHQIDKMLKEIKEKVDKK